MNTKQSLSLVLIALFGLFSAVSFVFAQVSVDTVTTLQNLTDSLFVPFSPVVSDGGAVVREITEDPRIQISKDRKALMLQIAAKDPEAFLQNAISKALTKDLPQEVLQNIEQEVSLSGTIDSVHIDTPQSLEESTPLSFLHTKDKIIQISSPEDLSLLKKNTVHTISGYQLGDAVVGYPEESPVAAPRDTSHTDSLGNQKVLVLPITFPDAQPVPLTKQQISDILFKGQVQNYFREASQGKVSWSGDVFDWVTIPKQKVISPCFTVMLNDLYKKNSMYMVPEMQKMIADRGIDISQYGRIFYFINTLDISGCSSLGKSPVSVAGKTYPISESWFGVSTESLKPYPTTPAISNLDELIFHELGHALGLHHAHGLDCGKESLGDDCKNIEYGNPFDVMGGGSPTLFSKHFSAYYKSLLGWLDADEQKEITEPGTYHLSPLEGTSSVQLLTVTNPAVAARGLPSQTYAIDFRQPVGHDAGLSQSDIVSQTKGVFIHQIDPRDTSISLIDTNATSGAWSTDVKKSALTSGTFTDKEQGIIIGPVSKVTSTGVDVMIRFQNSLLCEHVPPKVTLSAKQKTVLAGQVVYLPFQVNNPGKKTCGNTHYKIAFTLPIPDMNPSTATVNAINRDITSLLIQPKETKDVVLGLDTLESAPEGIYPVTITVTNLFDNTQTTVAYPVQIIPKPNIESLSPAHGNTGVSVIVKGSGFLQKGNQIIMSGQKTTFSVGNLSSADGKMLTFLFPKKTYDTVSKKLIVPTPGEYTISVQNGYLGSSPASFLLE